MRRRSWMRRRGLNFILRFIVVVWIFNDVYMMRKSKELHENASLYEFVRLDFMLIARLSRAIHLQVVEMPIKIY